MILRFDLSEPGFLSGCRPDSIPGDKGLPNRTGWKRLLDDVQPRVVLTLNGQRMCPMRHVIRRRKEPSMRSKGRDKAGGTLDKVRGRIREAGGALTGNDRS